MLAECSIRSKPEPEINFRETYCRSLPSKSFKAGMFTTPDQKKTRIILALSWRRDYANFCYPPFKSIIFLRSLTLFVRCRLTFKCFNKPSISATALSRSCCTRKAPASSQARSLGRREDRVYVKLLSHSRRRASNHTTHAQNSNL